VNWNGGTLVGSCTLPATVPLNISGVPKALASGSTINSAGKTTWTGTGYILVQGGSVFNNTGSFVAQNDAQFSYDSTAGAQPVFNNGGSFTKTNSTGITDFSVTYGGMAFNNSGSVNVQSGNLALGGGGTFAGGPLTTAAGSPLDFYAGVFSFNGTRTLTGPGTNLVNGASVTFNNVTNTLAGALTFEIDSGVVAGTNTFSGAGIVNWNGGTLVGSCTLPATVPLNISGVPKALASGSTINSAGKTTWTGTGYILVQGGSVFNNTGSFVAQNDAQFSYDSTAGAQPVFNNGGSFTKTNSTGITDFSVTYGGMAFNNSGSVNVQSGNLALGGGGTFAGGPLTTAAGSPLDFYAGVFSFNGTRTLTGPGTNLVNGASVTFNNVTNTLAGALTFEIDSGVVAGTNTFSGAGIVNWNGGTLVGSCTLPATVPLNISGVPKALASGSTINSAGKTTWTGTGYILVQGGSVFNNSGSVNVQSGNLALGGGGTFAGGPLTTAAGSLLDFYAGVFSFNGNRTLTGPGTNLVNGASVTFNNVTNTLAGALTFEIDSGVVAGTNTFSGAGIVNWNGGTLVGSCTLPATVPLNISGVPKALASGSTINSAGKTTWTGTGYILVQGGSVFNNTGSFVAQNDAQFSY